MILSLIAIMAENRVIGNKHRIPWNIPSDQQRFRRITLGHSIIFGRVTFEAIGHALPGRRNIVLTHRQDYAASDVVVMHSLDQALEACREEDEVFIGGGGMVFSETIGLADRLYLSVVHRAFDGDSFFPEIPPSFKEVSREEVAEALPYSVIRYERVK